MKIQIKHKHHIIPKHAGGTDEPSNLIELTIEEHAEAHRILFETYGKKEDELAWKGLAGLIPREQIMIEYYEYYRGENHPRFGIKRDASVKQKISEKLKGHIVSEETKKIWSEQRKGQKHSDERRKIRSEYNKLNNIKPPSQKDIPKSDEHKKKIGDGNRGKIRSEENKQKNRLANLGKSHSEETKQKISKANKGRKILWDLKSTTPEANAKRSKALTGKSKPIMICPQCGKSGGVPQMKQWHFDKCKGK